MGRWLVTGGAGFIGAALVADVRARGHDVVVVDLVPHERQARAVRQLLGDAAGGPEAVAAAGRAGGTVGGLRVVRADLGAVELRPLLDGVDVVVHLAGRPGVQTSWAGGFADHLQQNVAVSQRLLEACLDVGVGRVVLASSSSVYGEGPGRPAAEHDPVTPISPYGATKAAVELLARTYAARGVPAVCLRYFTVYGRGQRPDMAIHRILAAGLGGTPFALRGDGRQVRDFTHVDDVVEATVRAAEADVRPGEVLNVGGGRPVPLADVIDAVAALLGRPVPVVEAAAAPGDPAATACDGTRARRLLGWAPSVRLQDGLADQLAWQAGTTPLAALAEVSR